MKKRSAAEYARIYGSVARVKWVESLPCLAAPLCWGTIENHHVKVGGVSMKADAKYIVPLCSRHHHEIHNCGRLWFENRYRVDLSAEAARVQSLWLAQTEAA